MRRTSLPRGVWVALIFCTCITSTYATGQDAVKKAAGTQAASVPVANTKADTSTDKPTGQVAAPVYPQTLAGAKQAFKDQRYLDALKILLKLESDHAGQVAYDYLLGRAALENKKFDAAIAAFSRVLTVDPDFAAARFELARTYYSKGVAYLARGPFEQARLEFAIVEDMDPPAKLKDAIEQYQDNIDTYLEVRETEFRMFVEVTGGYDSNITTASEDEYFGYYDYGTNSQRTYYLRDGNERKDSGFSQIQAGIGIDWPLFSNNFEVFGNLMFGNRSYPTEHDYDQGWSEARFGVRHYGESNVKTFRFRHRSTDTIRDKKDSQSYHESNEGMLKLDVKNSDSNAMRFWLLGGDSSYHAYGTEVFSVGYNRQAFEATHIADGKRKSAFQLLIMIGEDYPQNCKEGNTCGPQNDTYARDLTGLRASWGINFFDASRFHTSLYTEKSDYKNDFFYQRRTDKRYELFLGTNTRFGDHWYYRQQIHYTRNDSNLDVYDHERWLVSLTLGWGR